MTRTGPFYLRVWGQMAAFVSGKRDEPMSFPVMTPSAARRVCEAIFWKPQMKWRILRIHILAPIKWFGVMVNEVKTVGSPNKPYIVIEEDRDQRRLTALRDVDYVIEADIETSDEDAIKMREMYLRRVEKGQCYQQPYLGRRECAASFEPLARIPEPHSSFANSVIDLGMLFLDFDYKDPVTPKYFPAEIRNGVLVGKDLDRIPMLEEVK